MHNLHILSSPILHHSSMAVDDEISGFPRFMKIILDLQKLEIPPKFMKRYGGNLLDVVHLSVPGGAKWEVKVVRENGKAWLQDGWAEFVKFYSILHTHVLVFTFEGNSRFHVIIMSNSASEIEYPVHVEPSQKRKNKETINSSAPISKRAKVAESVGDINQHKVIGSKCRLTPDESKRIEGYPCKQPSFVVKITPCQVEPKFNVLNIPLEFVRRYLQHELGMFILENVTQKKWPVRIKIGDSHVSFAKGWKNFTLENKLQVGDICVFELVNKRRFRVAILRRTAGEPSRSKAQAKLETDH